MTRQSQSADPSEPSSTSEHPICDKHGLRYDPRVTDGCVVCRRERARGRRAVGLVVVVIGAVAVAVLSTRAPPAEPATPAPTKSVIPRAERPVAAEPTAKSEVPPPSSVKLGTAEEAREPSVVVTESRRVIAAPERTNPADEIAKDFRERGKGHFTVRFEGHRETDLAYRALDILNEAYEDVRGRLRVAPADPIEVVIYTGGKYRAAVAGPDWSLARYDGKIRVGHADLMAEHGALRDTLYHEYGHALLSSGVDVPTWFHEGVAQYIEPSDERADTALLARAAAAGKLFTFEQLSRGFVGISDAQFAHLAYAQSLAIVEFMIALRGEDRLHGLIRQVAGGASFPSELRGTYGDRLERSFRDSLGG